MSPEPCAGSAPGEDQRAGLCYACRGIHRQTEGRATGDRGEGDDGQFLQFIQY